MATPNIELLYGGAWHDVTGDFLREDATAGGGITVERGASSEASSTEPGVCSLTVNNGVSRVNPAVSGRYSPRNPRSDLHGLIGRNTPIRVGVDGLVDSFARTVADGWGTTDTGLAWALNGTATNYDVAGGVGTIVSTGSGAVPAATVGQFGDADVLARFSVSALNAALQFGIVTHWQDDNNHYRFVVDLFSTDKLRMTKFVGGIQITSSAWDTTDGVPTIATDTWYWMRVSVAKADGLLRAKLWADADPEPAGWMLSNFDTDPFSAGTLPRIGAVGVIAAFGSGATVSVDDFRADNWRFHGEIPAWPARRDVSDRDRWAPIEAAGILRRLGTGSAARPVASVIRREAMAATYDPVRVCYWPCEDESQAASLASALSGGAPMGVKGEWEPAAYSGFGASAPLPVLGVGGNATGAVPAHAAGAEFYRGLFAVPAGGATNGASLLGMRFVGGTVGRAEVTYGSGGTLQLRFEDHDGAEINATSAFGFAVNGTQFLMSLELVQDGADVDWLLFARKVSLDGTVEGGGLETGTFTSRTLGSLIRIGIGKTGGLDGVAFGHQMLGTAQNFVFDHFLGSTPWLGAWAGESAGRRVERLCAERGVEFAGVGDLDDCQPVGPQRIASFLELLADAARVDFGIVYEPRQFFGLGYRTGRSLYNQTPVVLDYSARQVAPALEPMPDDLGLVNDFTAHRRDGSSARYVKVTGPNNANEPAADPDGIGPVEGEDTFDAVSDVALPSLAAWTVYLGTVDEDRVPAISVNMANPAVSGNTALATAVLAADVGDLLAVTHPPDDLPPEDIRQIVRGYTESIDQSVHAITVNGSPAAPFEVGEVAAADGSHDVRGQAVDTDHSTLAAGVDTDDTTLSVATDLAGSPIRSLWTTDPDDVDDTLHGGPLLIRIGGEVLEVTSISGASSPQTFAVVRGHNGLATAHDAGDPVHVAFPAVIGI
jgi:hypothetical protein